MNAVPKDADAVFDDAVANFTDAIADDTVADVTNAISDDAVSDVTDSTDAIHVVIPPNAIPDDAIHDDAATTHTTSIAPKTTWPGHRPHQRRHQHLLRMTLLPPTPTPMSDSRLY